MQFYTGNFLDGKMKGKGGVVIRSIRRSAWRRSTSPIRCNHAEFPVDHPEAGADVHADDGVQVLGEVMVKSTAPRQASRRA